MLSKSSLSIIAIILLIITLSCAKRLTFSPEQRLTPEEYLQELKKIKNMKFIFSINLKRNDETISGDASLKINGEETKLSIYSMGFLISEIKTEGNSIEMKGKNLNKEKAILLIEGLRNTFMWWNIEEMEIQKIDDTVILRNSWRKVFLERRSLIPFQQYIYLDRSFTISILYSEPEKISAINNIDSLYFPSKINITIPKNGEIIMKVKEIEIL